MEYTELMEYLEKLWYYLPYMLYTYIFLTLLPKSFMKIKEAADANYEANRYKFHRCFAPDLCCHHLILEDISPVNSKHANTKPRKCATRSYPKRQNAVANDSGYPSTSSEHSSGYSVSRKPVQTYTHVNQIARMFETGGVATSHQANEAINSHNYITGSKKINRVTPIILPSELRAQHSYKSEVYYNGHMEKPKLRSIPKNTSQRRNSAEEFAEMLLAEKLLDLDDFELLQQHDDMETETVSSDNADLLTVPVIWQAENLHVRGQHHQGTSATPSTASPTASCTPSPPVSPQRQLSPVPANMVPLRRKFPYRSSIEDIFAALAHNAEIFEPPCTYAAGNLSPVTSIDDILAERRLSRPLSAYSISDLLFNEDNSLITNNFKS